MKRSATSAARPDGYHRRMVSGLRRDEEALGALRAAGLDDAEIADLGLGLREPYARADGSVVSRGLCYPLARDGGRCRFGYVNLAGVSANPEHADAWSPGDAATVRRGAGEAALIVAATPLAAWRLGFAAARAGVEVTVVASSQPDRVPADWETNRFWARWPRIVLSAEVSAVLRETIAVAARRPLEICRSEMPAAGQPDVRDLDERWARDLVERGGPIGGADVLGDDEPADTAAGDFAADPVALHGGVSRGQMLYPFRVERRSRAAGGRLNHSYETLVLRGDGAVLEAQVLPSPPGTPAHRRVHALTDGTRILAAPEPSRTASWSLDGIRAFAAARAGGRDLLGRMPAEVLHDVHAFIGARVSLPRPDDLWIASGFVVMSHLFRVFPALPILLVEGPKGSGKSELAGAVAALGYNATVMGQGSGAALVRLASDCGGLVVLDDVEGLSGEGGASGELGQCLKTGYKAATGRKAISSPSGHVRVHDFYGPRLVTTTRGLDPVLASRCLRICTSPDAAPRGLCDVDAVALRDELHALAMSRAAQIAEAYAPFGAAASTRSAEIVAPLRALAAALASAELAEALAIG